MDPRIALQHAKALIVPGCRPDFLDAQAFEAQPPVRRWDASMLLRLSQHIAACFERAREADARAAKSGDPAQKTEYEAIARSWRNLARSYEFVESLERFLLDADRHKAPLQPEPPETAQPAPHKDQSPGSRNT
jgi:hypothetical protein